jgi:CheY-like chemotaxis protein
MEKIVTAAGATVDIGGTIDKSLARDGFSIASYIAWDSVNVKTVVSEVNSSEEKGIPVDSICEPLVLTADLLSIQDSHVVSSDLKEVSISQGEYIVFVVDDEIVISETLSAILNRAGFKAFSFTHARNAIAACRGAVPDLLISDVSMPEMTGVELAIYFRRTHPQCKILLFSGQAETTDLLLEARNGGYDFELISKPVHPSELLAKCGVGRRSKSRQSIANSKTLTIEIPAFGIPCSSK